MASHYSELEKMALQLDEFERERLLDTLADSLTGKRDILTPEWTCEVEHRIDEWESGDRATIEAVPFLENLRRQVR